MGRTIDLAIAFAPLMTGVVLVKLGFRVSEQVDAVLFFASAGFALCYWLFADGFRRGRASDCLDLHLCKRRQRLGDKLARTKVIRAGGVTEACFQLQSPQRSIGLGRPASRIGRLRLAKCVCKADWGSLLTRTRRSYWALFWMIAAV